MQHLRYSGLKMAAEKQKQGGQEGQRYRKKSKAGKTRLVRNVLPITALLCTSVIVSIESNRRFALVVGEKYPLAS